VDLIFFPPPPISFHASSSFLFSTFPNFYCFFVFSELSLSSPRKFCRVAGRSFLRSPRITFLAASRFTFPLCHFCCVPPPKVLDIFSSRSFFSNVVVFLLLDLASFLDSSLMVWHLAPCTSSRDVRFSLISLFRSSVPLSGVGSHYLVHLWSLATFQLLSSISGWGPFATHSTPLLFNVTN